MAAGITKFRQHIYPWVIYSCSILFLCTLTLHQTRAGDEQDPAHLYQTWEGMEPDKGASAWLIKRFIDPQARFVVRPYGEELKAGTAFDVPESRFRRTHRWSTFEALINEYKITDKAVKYLGLIIHDIEINTWGQKKIRQTPQVEYLVNELRQIYGDKTINLDCYIVLFEEIYQRLGKSVEGDLDITPPTKCMLKANHTK